MIEQKKNILIYIPIFLISITIIQLLIYYQREYYIDNDDYCSNNCPPKNNINKYFYCSTNNCPPKNIKKLKC